MAAITGFGMLSHSAISLAEKSSIVRRIVGPLATGQARKSILASRLETNRPQNGAHTLHRTGRSGVINTARSLAAS